MSVHGDDIVITIRRALAAPELSAQASMQTDVRIHPNPEQGWKNRDGRLVFDCVGRDWIRAFRVTVEAIEIDECEGELGSDEWVVVE